MRNLKLIKKVLYPHGKHLPGELVFCVGENSSLIFCDNASHRLFRILYNDVNFMEPEELDEDESLLQNVFKMQFLVSTAALFIATKSGAFLQYYMHNKVQELLQSGQGISTFAVCPDSRMVVIITLEGTLLLMSLPDLEVITQINLKANESDSVQKETATYEVNWLHDSTYFVVNCFDTTTGLRKLHFYDDNGVLYSTTEDCNPLTSDITAWQPSGGLIAAIGQATSPKDNVMVSLFELNGLKRADFFTLENSRNEKHVTAMLWNSASDILALNMGTRIELWTRNNYRWMLKNIAQDFVDGEDNSVGRNVLYVSWDPELPNRLHVFYESSKYVVYDFAFAYTSGRSGGSAISASVNGNFMYCTPFRDNCAPPPDCFFQITLPTIPVQVIVNSFWNGILCVLSNGTIEYYKNSRSSMNLLETRKLPEWQKCRSSYSWVWPNETTLCCSDGEYLSIFSLNPVTTPESKDENMPNNDVVLQSREMLKCISIQQVCEFIEQTYFILMQQIDGLISLLNIKTKEVKSICKFPVTCSDVKYIFCNERVKEEDKYANIIVFGHDPVTRKLYAGWSKDTSNAYQLSGECTSVSTYQDNLLFTTIQGSLEIINGKNVERILNSNSAVTGLLSSEHAPYSRKSEKGSIIASCCLNQMYEPCLVLQILPRGNLETIYPRPLVISSINLLLRDKSLRHFAKIMAAMRRHRIDYNILIDELKNIEKEDPTMTLLSNLEDMVNQVKDSHSLVLLVTEMNQNNYDCLKIIKTILEEYMNKQDGKNVDQPYLAVMAKLGLYEEVLRSQLISGDEALRELVKSRIKFLSFYCDNPEILYESALGTYDLTLAAIVADCLNKDPKEYIPILNEYQAMTPEKRYYTIDNSLRRYNCAVKSLINDESVQEDEILRYIDRHRLFVDALNYLSCLYKTKENDCTGRSLTFVTELIKETQNLYGMYLKNHGKLREASIFFARSQNYDDAIDSCLQTGNWEYAVELAHQSTRDETTNEKLSSICRRMVESLEEKQEYEGAARISEVYLGDVKAAVGLLVKAQKWTMAASLCFKDPSLGQQEVDCQVKSKLIEAAVSMEDNINSSLKDIIHYEKRLQIVKIAKENRKNFDDENDSFSDTDSISTGSGSYRTFSSSNTGSSGKTHRTNKNKRKQERKVFSLKEGSSFEDYAITVHLWESFNQINLKLKLEVSSLIESLWRFELDENALTLTSVFETLIAEVDKGVKEVWATMLPENHLLEPKFRLPPTGWSISWDKLSFVHPTSGRSKK